MHNINEPILLIIKFIIKQTICGFKNRANINITYYITGAGEFDDFVQPYFWRPNRQLGMECDINHLIEI